MCVCCSCLFLYVSCVFIFLVPKLCILHRQIPSKHLGHGYAKAIEQHVRTGRNITQPSPETSASRTSYQTFVRTTSKNVKVWGGSKIWRDCTSCAMQCADRTFSSAKAFKLLALVRPEDQNLATLEPSKSTTPCWVVKPCHWLRLNLIPKQRKEHWEQVIYNI